MWRWHNAVSNSRALMNSGTWKCVGNVRKSLVAICVHVCKFHLLFRWESKHHKADAALPISCVWCGDKHKRGTQHTCPSLCTLIHTIRHEHAPPFAAAEYLRTGSALIDSFFKALHILRIWVSTCRNTIPIAHAHFTYRLQRRPALSVPSSSRLSFDAQLQLVRQLAPWARGSAVTCYCHFIVVAAGCWLAADIWRLLTLGWGLFRTLLVFMSGTRDGCCCYL